MHDGDVVTFLRSVPLFASLSDGDIHRVMKSLGEQAVSSGTLVTLQGHPIDALYLVISGHLKRFRVGPGGREQTLTLLGPGDIFPGVPVLDGIDDPASTRALQTSRLYVWPRGSALNLVQESPDFAMAVISFLTGRVHYLTGLVEELTLYTTRERMARYILRHSTGTRRPPLVQAEIASLLGTTREGVVRSLRSLQVSGAIALHHGRVLVSDRALLEDIAAGKRGPQ